jgi:hypothetical protein
MKLYVASSWRNAFQQDIVAQLRGAGHEVYDFRNPAEGNHGFHWSEIDPEWQTWSPGQFRDALSHDVAEAGFGLDWGAMQWADGGILVLPCGRSAHLEAGYFAGAGKFLAILLAPGEPELMYKMADAICLSVIDVLSAIIDYQAAREAVEREGGRRE